MDYIAHLLIIMGIYLTLAVSLDLIAGYTGLLSLAQAAFYGIGAYVAALLALQLHTPFVVNLVAAMLAAGLFGVVVGAPSLRVRDDYFVIASFCFQLITFGVLRNWVSVTGGAAGLPGIPALKVFGRSFASDATFLIVVAAFGLFTLFIVRRLAKAPFGRVLRAIREDEIFAQSLGKNVPRYKLIVFMIGAALAAGAGSLYAYYMSYIDPSAFTVMESILVVSMVILGGAGTTWGAALGAALLVLLPEALRMVGLPSSVAPAVRQMLYGALLVLCMRFRPQGLIGEYSFGRG